MAEITTMLDNLLSNTKLFSDPRGTDIAINFVNELDATTLYQFENGSERTIMECYEELIRASEAEARPAGPGGEGGIPMLSRSGQVLRQDSAFFKQYNTSVPGFRGYGGNVYDDPHKIKYEYAAKVVNTATMLSGTGAAAAAAANAQNTAARLALISLGGLFGLAGGALLSLRNTRADIQVANNKQFLEGVKLIVKYSGKVEKLFVDANNKIAKDKDKAAAQLDIELSNIRSGRNPNYISSRQQNASLAEMDTLVRQDFSNALYNIKTRILPQGNGGWRVSIGAAGINAKSFGTLEIDMLERILSRL